MGPVLRESVYENEVDFVCLLEEEAAEEDERAETE
jgi:hypothetical protein